MEHTAEGYKRAFKRLAIGLGLVGLVAVVALALLPELRNYVLYRIAPGYARDANFVRLQKGPVDVYLLGTIHGRHLTTEEYSLAHLKAAITRLEPDFVLVEARPEEIARGRWGDGPIEMPFSALTARAAGITVDGIDWWQLSETEGRSTDDERDDRIYEHLKSKLPVKGVVLVLIGFSHIPELVDRLEDDGFEESDFDKTQLFELVDEPFAYPAGMSAAISQRIADAEAEADSEGRSKGAADQLRALAADRKRFLKEVQSIGEYPARP